MTTEEVTGDPRAEGLWRVENDYAREFFVDGELQITCPRCVDPETGGYVHVTDQLVIVRSDNHPVGSLGRRSGYTGLGLWCEQGHVGELIVSFHKGQTVVASRWALETVADDGNWPRLIHRGPERRDAIVVFADEIEAEKLNETKGDFR